MEFHQILTKIMKLRYPRLVALPQSLLAGSPRAAVPPLGMAGKAWVGVFAAGFVIEGMADVQKLGDHTTSTITSTTTPHK